MSNTAYDLLMSQWNGSIPVDVEAIARSLGIKVCPRFGMAGGESGCISRSDDDEYTIEYDATQSRVRQRFTIAHELGHFALGHLQRGQREFRDNPAHFMTAIALPRERDANAFAAKVLMPEAMLRRLIVEHSVTSVGALANIFNVSRAAMTFRLKNLGVNNIDYS